MPVNEAPQPVLVLASGEWSEVLPAPSRPTVKVPLVVERTRPSFKRKPTVLDGLEAEARRLAAMSPPYRWIFEVTRTAESVVLVGERFVGLTASELVKALSTEGRLLPLDVWLRLAVELTQVLDEPAPCGPAASGGLRSLGIDVRRRLVIFPDPLILRKAWSKEPERRWPSGLAFRDALLGAAGVAPASMEQAATLILGAGFARVRQRLRDLEREPECEWLPEVWRSGGLRVLEDELLEALPPFERLPQRRHS